MSVLDGVTELDVRVCERQTPLPLVEQGRGLTMVSCISGAEADAVCRCKNRIFEKGSKILMFSHEYAHKCIKQYTHSF